jgi:predicted RNA-binding protein YlxR (DUF448 family)
MAHKKGRRPRHIPQRTCVGCREHSAKSELLRLVRTPNGVIADHSGKMDGRGAYIHANKECLQRAMKASLAKALRIALSEDDRERLQTLKQSLPPERGTIEEKIKA